MNRLKLYIMVSIVGLALFISCDEQEQKEVWGEHWYYQSANSHLVFGFDVDRNGGHITPSYAYLNYMVRPDVVSVSPIQNSTIAEVVLKASSEHYVILKNLTSVNEDKITVGEMIFKIPGELEKVLKGEVITKVQRSEHTKMEFKGITPVYVGNYLLKGDLTLKITVDEIAGVSSDSIVFNDQYYNSSSSQGILAKSGSGADIIITEGDFKAEMHNAFLKYNNVYVDSVLVFNKGVLELIIKEAVFLKYK